MLDRDRLKDLHNQVTDLHKMTSAAAGGVGAIDWTGALEMVINVLNLFKDHLNVVQNETRQAAMNISREPNQQGDHQELPRDKDNLTKHIEPVDTKDQTHNVGSPLNPNEPPNPSPGVKQSEPKPAQEWNKPALNPEPNKPDKSVPTPEPKKVDTDKDKGTVSPDQGKKNPTDLTIK